MNKKPFERPVIKKVVAGMPSKFGIHPGTTVVSHIDDFMVSDLLKEYGSPLYVISESTIRKTCKEAKSAFSTRYPRVQFAWSYKTNYLNAICSVFHQEGAWAEVVSRFEYDKALKNRNEGKNIIFNGPDKSLDDLEFAVKNNSLIHIDHFDEMYSLFEISDKLSVKPKVAIRVNMNTGIYPLWDRFGFNYENGEAWEAINRIMLGKKLDLVGLHTHIGTYILSADAYKTAATKLADLAVNIKLKYGQVIQYIDLGGGFASKNTLKGSYLSGDDTTPSFDEYADAISSGLINSQIKPEELPVLILETGRALIDDAGYLLGTVLANKRLADGRRAMIMDAGVNLLFTSFWYNHKINPAQPASAHTEETVIYGPLCMNIDVLRDTVDFPALKKGDHFVVSRIGAYNMTQWLQFITMRPRVVMIGMDKKIHVIRENETNEYIESLEKVPDYLKK